LKQLKTQALLFSPYKDKQNFQLYIVKKGVYLYDERGREMAQQLREFIHIHRERDRERERQRERYILVKENKKAVGICKNTDT
jgi:hypothetical protein